MSVYRDIYHRVMISVSICGDNSCLRLQDDLFLGYIIGWVSVAEDNSTCNTIR